MANPNLKRIVKTSTTLSLKGTLDSDTGSINTEEDNYDLLVLLEFFDDKLWLHTINGSCWKKVNNQSDKDNHVREYLDTILA